MSENEDLSQVLDGILNRYRDASGNVNYFALMGDASIVQFAESLARFDVQSLETREEKLAFWINCYNSFSIYGVIRKLKEDPNFAEKGNSSWFQRVRFFALQKFDVGGKEYTLRTIENHVRDEFKDPRIHFALNCSSMGCPILKDGLYSAGNIDAELDAASKLYLGNPQGAHLDKEEGILFLSMIFKWYKKDFEDTGKSIVEFVSQYVAEDIKSYILENKDTIKVKYIEYNWSLNQSEEG